VNPLVRVARSFLRPRRERRERAGADVVVVSFPKSGRTWLRLLIGKVLCDRYGLPERSMLDTRALTAAAGLPVTVFSHDGSSNAEARHWRRLSRDKGEYRSKKVLLLAREPRDVVVSCYFQASRRRDEYHGDLSSFLRDPRHGIRKVLVWSRIWSESSRIPRAFRVVRYEDLHAAPEKTLREVLEFLGIQDVPDPTIRAAIEFARFDNMRRLEAAGRFQAGKLRPRRADDPESYKTRKGKVGGHADYLGPEDLAYADRVLAEFGDPFARPPIA
jgi:hypothetical protein